MEKKMPLSRDLFNIVYIDESSKGDSKSLWKSLEVKLRGDVFDFDEFINKLCTNKTSFFREPMHFSFLQKHYLPILMKRRSGLEQVRIRGWSAGCSSGEEPYSLALVLRFGRFSSVPTTSVLAASIPQTSRCTSSRS